MCWIALSFALVTVLDVADLQAGPQAATPSQVRQETPAKRSPFVGKWSADLSKSKQNPKYKFESATLQIAVDGATVTITSGVLLASGLEERTETFQADGKDHPFEQSPLGSGVSVMARWVNAHVLETVAKKDGQEIARATYEISTDGKTLTARTSGMLEQVIVFDRM
jgi:hypothetical protein